MKLKIAAVVALCQFAATTTFAQWAGEEEIEGTGTANYLPVFTGSHRIGNSNIFQSPAGNVGIGTTNPLFPLHIFSSSTTPPPGHDKPVTLWVETSAGNTQDAIQALASAAAGDTIAVNGTTFSPDGVAVLGNHVGGAGGGSGVVGQTDSTTGFSTGVSGASSGNTGPGLGVFGSSNSPDGGGGFFQNNSLQGGTGLSGVTYSTNGFAVGVRGISVGTTGDGVGVFGTTNSPQGVGGLFQNVPGGDIIRGGINQPVVNLFRVDGTGKVFADGGFQPNGADFAESMAVTGDRAKYVAGDLLVIDPSTNRHLALADQPYSTLVAGIYSTKPGVLGSTRTVDEPTAKDEVPLAVVGIVPCKVTAENGAIRVGDLLVTSSTPGHAMKGTDRNKMLGAVVGKALEPLDDGKGVIQVLVTLQ